MLLKPNRVPMPYILKGDTSFLTCAPWVTHDAQSPPDARDRSTLGTAKEGREIRGPNVN